KEPSGTILDDLLRTQLLLDESLGGSTIRRRAKPACCHSITSRRSIVALAKERRPNIGRESNTETGNVQGESGMEVTVLQLQFRDLSFRLDLAHSCAHDRDD